MSALKIIVVSQKGGVGKSTISANLAAWFRAEAGRSTVVLDLDPHGSSSTWIRDARPIGVDAIHQPVEEVGARRWLLSARAHLRRATEHYDVVVVDLTWTISMDSEFLLGFDLVLVPSGISEIEVQASMDFIEKNRWVFESLRTVPPTLVLCPSRVRQDQMLDHAFNGKNFPVRFVLSPPVYDDPNIRDLFRKDYLISRPGPVGHNFRQFAEAILQAAHIHMSNYKDLPTTMEGRRALDNHNTLLTRHMAKRSRGVGGLPSSPAFLGKVAMPEADNPMPNANPVRRTVNSEMGDTSSPSTRPKSDAKSMGSDRRPPPRTPAFLKLLGGFDKKP